MPVINDQYDRKFKTLRVSLLSHCNLGCVYCVAGDGAAAADYMLSDAGAAAATGSHLSVPDLLRIIERLHGQLGLDTVRLTGGEPLLYAGLPLLISGIRSVGISHIKLTTNGFLLERLAVSLREAGMESINVSLDAIDEEVFFLMSRRRRAERIIRGIDAAVAAGLNVKINTVVMKGMNDSQIFPLLEFAASRDLRIRFLEIMAMGHLHDKADRYLCSQADILSVIGERYRITPLGRESAATAAYWQMENGQIFGIIANDSEPFCKDCDRLRLDSQGNIYGCLSSNRPIPLGLAEDESNWNEKLREAMGQKQALRFTGSDLSMLHIGG